MRTELIADQPTIVLLHQGEGVSRVIKAALEKQSVRVHLYLAHDLEDDRDKADREKILSEAYKICWFVTPDWFLQTSLEKKQRVLSKIEQHQRKTTIITPVISQYSEDFPGEIPYISRYCQGQQHTVAWLNRSLSGAQWLFLQDIVLPASLLQTTLTTFLAQDIQAGKIYAPQTTWFPFNFQLAVERVVHYFLQPSRGSFVIRGQVKTGSEIVDQIKRSYQSLYFNPISIQAVAGKTDSPIPFSATENIVIEGLEQSLLEFVKAFPSPNSTFFQFDWQNSLDTTSIEREQSHTPPLSSKNEASMSAVSSKSGSNLDSSAQSQSELEPAPTEQVVLNTSQQKGVVSPPDSKPVLKATEPKTETTESAEISKTTSNTDANAQTPENKTPVDAFNLNQEIVRLFATSHLTTKRDRTRVATKERTKIIKKSKKRNALFYGGLTFTGMGLGIVFLMVVFMTSVNLLSREVRQNTEVLISSLSGKTGDSPTFGPLKGVVDLQAGAYSTVLSLPALDDAQELVTLAEMIESTHQITQRSQETTQNLVDNILRSQNTQIESVAPNLAADGATAYENIEALSELLNTSFLWHEESTEFEAMQANLESVSQLYQNGQVILQQLGAVLPDLLAGNEQRSYALVFQNNQELRPTGGFIEAVAIVTISQDGLVGSRVLNSYDIDQNLPGTVQAPELITRYFGDEQLLFHDSNWDPHFPASAEQITWFVEKSLNQEIDGVLTIDVPGLARVLEHLGPLELAEYNEVVTHRTLADRIEFHSEVMLFNESSQKDYRQVVFEAVLEKMQQTPKEKSTALLQAIRSNFEEQSMLFVPKRATELQAFRGLGWTGGILDPQCPAQLSRGICQMETVAQFEANVGVNKANYYLERSIEHVVAMQQNTVFHERAISYTNTAQSNAWPKGPYKSYVRLYLPIDAVVEAVQIEQTTLTPEELEMSEDQQKKIIGFYIEVPVNTTLPVVVRYSTPLQSQGAASFAYALFEQQQPGITQSTYRFRVTPPPSYKPILIAPQPDVQGEDILFVKEDLGHSVFGLQVQRGE